MTDHFCLSALFADPALAIRALAKAQELEQGIRAAAGSAASADGRVRVDWSEAGGIDGLVVDPRVLRLGSDELAVQLITAVNAARAHSQEQIGSLVADVLGDGAPDPREMMEQLPDLREQIDDIMRDTAEMRSTVTGIVERMRARAEE